MIRTLCLSLIILCVFSCKKKEERRNTPSPEVSTEKEWTSFEDDRYQIALRYLKNYKVVAGSLAGSTPVINVFNKANKTKPPYEIHEAFSESYIAFLPKGFGVDGPAGDQQKLSEFGNPLPLSFEIDLEKSRVFLLENTQPWGFYLRFHTPPESWKAHGGIFIRYSVSDFEAVCLTADGEINIKHCDPMGGEHQVTYRGEVSQENIAELNKMLKTLNFPRENFNRRELSDLIKVDFPEAGDKISSPVKIKGEARGNWFFEANAGIEILDRDFKKIGEGYIAVKNADWMTENFVPFTGEVSFKKTASKQGYVVFKNANASGKPELDRIFRIPVQFE